MATEYSNGDLVIFAGDFNINAAPACPAEVACKEAMTVENQKRKDKVVQKTPYADEAIDLIFDEYNKGLVASLQNELWDLKDCLRDSALGGKGEFSPVTYGGEETNEKGEIVNCAPSLIVTEDSMCKMALDYVFEMRMKSSEKDSERFSVDVDKT